jgi:hypothetical protein
MAVMDQQLTHSSIDQSQSELENYLLTEAVVNQEQLAVAKRMQARQEGPLLMILLQLSFIDLKQFSRLLDWIPQSNSVNSFPEAS